MQTKCEQIMNEYLALDKNQRVPLKISKHLLTCEHCRSKIKLIATAEKQISAPLKVEANKTDSSIEAVMSEINKIEMEKIRKHQLPVIWWVIFGLIMIVLLVGATQYIRGFNNNYITSTYALLLAGCIIGYTAVFVYSHIDAFVKKISTVVKGIQPSA